MKISLQRSYRCWRASLIAQFHQRNALESRFHVMVQEIWRNGPALQGIDILLGLLFVPWKSSDLLVGLCVYSSCDFIGGNGPGKPKGMESLLSESFTVLKFAF